MYVLKNIFFQKCKILFFFHYQWVSAETATTTVNKKNDCPNCADEVERTVLNEMGLFVVIKAVLLISLLKNCFQY